MRPLTEPGEGRCIGLVAMLLEQVRNAAPDPASAKASMDQYKRLAGRLGVRRANDFISRCSERDTGRNGTDESPAADVWLSHEDLPLVLQSQLGPEPVPCPCGEPAFSLYFRLLIAQCNKAEGWGVA